MNIIILCVLLIAAVIADAGEDALNKRGLTFWGHTFGGLMVLILLYAGFFAVISHPATWTDPWWFLALLFGYMGFRFSLFNAAWNLFSKQRMNYIGTTDVFDKLERMYMPWWTFWFTRAFAFVFGGLLVYVFYHLK